MVRHTLCTRCAHIRPTLLISLILLTSARCAPGRIALPMGLGQPFPDYASVFAEVTDECRRVRTLEAELRLTGHTGGSRLRGRVLAGLAAPESVRLVGVAPFGPPAFILVARPTHATLLLPRERRVLTGEPASAILEALAGVALGPDDLRSALTGCVVPNPEPVAGRAYGDEWVAVDLRVGATAYLKAVDGERRVVVGVRGAVSLEYGNFVRKIPRRVRFLSSDFGGTAVPQDTDLTVTMSQVQMNVTLGPEAFSLEIPVDALPLTLEQLRRAGPLGSERLPSRGGA